MALINCPECNKEISNKAQSCPSCGAPLLLSKVVKIKFPRGQQLLNMNCSVYDENNNLLAKCKEGEVANFEIEEETLIYVYMNSRIGRASIVAHPGDRFEVNFRTFGIGISKVDIL